MYNRTSATLMLQTIMVLMEKQNLTDVTNFPGTFYEDAEIERCYDKFGCFSKAYPWTEHRPDNNFPAPPESLGVRYAVFTRRNRKLPIQNMADALLNLEGNDAASVIVVDWRRGSQPPYGQAVANIRLVGNNLRLRNLENFHFIGHSLGAHLAGYCGHALQKTRLRHISATPSRWCAWIVPTRTMSISYTAMPCPSTTQVLEYRNP
ncbi:unnamed protein product [Leptidea sinapis]|uniref:Lipase domain-containing protein n=1 Tax=Leptidea sinapis TaxID=189913 RepID=A0A5E4QJZ1_9NEOP|nr:unnamed protein product [Leptidea sinapis]